MLPSGLTLSVLRFILLQSQDNLASKIVRLLTFATVSQGYLLYEGCYASVVEHLLEGVELLESV